MTAQLPPSAAPQRGLRIAGVPVRIDPFFLVLVLVIGFRPGQELWQMVAWVVIVTLSVLIHEAGHAIAFRAFGHDAGIVLTGFGGMTQGVPRPGQPPLREGQHIIVSLAGPIAGFLAGAAALAVGQVLTGEVADDLIAIIVLVNIGWGLLNLLPVLPLDGGHVMASGLRIVLGPGRGTQVAYIVSATIAGLGALYAWSVGLVFAAVIGAMFAFMSIRGMRASAAPPAVDLTDRARYATQLVAAGRADEAVTELRAVLAAGPPPDVALRVNQVLGWALLAAGRADAVAEHVDRERRLQHPVALLDGMASAATDPARARVQIADGLCNEPVDPPAWAADDRWLQLDDALFDAIASEPRAVGGYERLALWLLRAQQYGSVLRAASGAAARGLDSAELDDSAMAAAQSLGRHEDAEAWARRAEGIRRAAQ